jgi:sarcosine oxidase
VLGTRDGAVLAGARLSARTHAIAHEELSGAEVRRRWPAITSPEGTLGLFEVGGGLLAVEDCVDAALQRARRHGADLRFDEPVLEWEADGSGVSVGTARGRYAGGTLVLSAGPWAAGLLQGLALPLAVERQVAFWFEAAREAESLGADRCPIVLWEPAPSQLFYTIPDVGDGLKAAVHHQGDATEPDRVRPVDATDEAAVRALLARLLPAANGRVRNAVTCLYTNTPDENFIVDRHPEHPQVMVVSPCSGHGFKFSSAIGEIVADLLTEGSRRFDLTPFRLSRLMSSPR